MLRKVLVGVGSVVFLFSAFMAGAGELEMRHFLFQEDFEESDPVKSWVTNGKYTVNFKGLTEENFFSGKKSFKLDVTFQEGRYFYWKLPLPKSIPAEGKLKYSGYIYLGEESTGTAVLGVQLGIAGGNKEIGSGSPKFGGARSKGEWKLIEGDIVSSGKSLAMGIASERWGVKKENVGVYVGRTGLFLFGRKGKRVVVYVDDIKIEGEIPIEGSYKQEIKRRWAPVKKKFAEKISLWEKALEKRQKEIASLIDLSPEAEKKKEEVKEKIDSLKGRIKAITSRRYIRFSEQREIDLLLEGSRKSIKNVKFISETEEKDMLVYVISPITSLKINPFDSVIPGKISKEIEMVATPGEYESASFIIHALSDITSLNCSIFK